MYKRITAAFAGTAAGLFLLFLPQASAAPKPAGDCGRVAPADRAVCRSVQAQHAYGWTDRKGNPLNWVVRGSVLVREITHQGYSKGEMGDALRAEARSYRDHVTSVKFDTDWMREACGNTDGAGVVSFVDEDGKPGGRKYVWARIICP